MITVAFSKAATIALIAGIGLSSASFQAIASGDTFERITEDSTSRTVGYSDLNLADTADAAELHKRILKAARHACRDRNDTSHLNGYRLYAKCVQIAVDDAVADVNNINLTRLHQGRSSALARN